ncbi:MAG: hypothetical protein ACK4M7_07810, partial [Burkholderiales bacterium]
FVVGDVKKETIPVSENHPVAETVVILEVKAYVIDKYGTPGEKGADIELVLKEDEADKFFANYSKLLTNKAYLARNPELVKLISTNEELETKTHVFKDIKIPGIEKNTIIKGIKIEEIKKSAGEAYNSYRKLLVLADNLGAYTEEFSRVVGRNSLTQEELPLSAEITRRRNKLNINAQAWSAISNTNHIISTSATSLMQSQQMRYNSVAQYSNEMQHVMTTMMGAVAQSVQDNISGITNSMRDMLNSVMETLRSAYQVMQQATNAR